MMPFGVWKHISVTFRTISFHWLEGQLGHKRLLFIQVCNEMRMNKWWLFFWLKCPFKLLILLCLIFPLFFICFCFLFISPCFFSRLCGMRFGHRAEDRCRLLTADVCFNVSVHTCSCSECWQSPEQQQDTQHKNLDRSLWQSVGLL